MKALRFTLSLIFFTCSFNQVSAQTVKGIPLEELDLEYIVISAYRATLTIDFAQYGFHSNIGKRNRILLDAQGNSIDFQRTLLALNFFAKHGFELLQALLHDGQTRYIMRRKPAEKRE